MSGNIDLDEAIRRWRRAFLPEKTGVLSPSNVEEVANLAIELVPALLARARRVDGAIEVIRNMPDRWPNEADEGGALAWVRLNEALGYLR